MSLSNIVLVESLHNRVILSLYYLIKQFSNLIVLCNVMWIRQSSDIKFSSTPNYIYVFLPRKILYIYIWRSDRISRFSHIVSSFGVVPPKVLKLAVF